MSSITKLTSSDKSLLMAKTPKALPDNPSDKGFSASQIKLKMYEGYSVLFDWLQATQEQAINDIDNISSTVSSDYAALAGNNTFTGTNHFNGQLWMLNNLIIDGWDSTNSALSLLYSYLYTNTKDYFVKVGIQSNQYVTYKLPYDYDDGGAVTYTLATTSYSDTNLATAKTYADGLLVTAKSYADGVGTSANTYTDNEIAKVQDGTYTAKKATQDGDGETISSTYVKKSQIYDGVDSTSTTVPLSANQGKVLKGLIDAIQTLLASDDSTLDELQEIVTYIKNNKSLIDGVTASKVSVSDIVDNLTTQVATKPLSANQGYVLDQKIGDLTDDYIALGLVEVGDYNQSTGEIEITHSTNLTSSYESTTGVLTITY